VAPSAKVETANILGTRNILEAARAAGVRRLVHVSSESVTLTSFCRKTRFSA
jgi:nucleoside-diphosphate-sugar epimerase